MLEEREEEKKVAGLELHAQADLAAVDGAADAVDLGKADEFPFAAQKDVRQKRDIHAEAKREAANDGIVFRAAAGENDRRLRHAADGNDVCYGCVDRIIEAADRAADKGIRQELAKGVSGARAQRRVVDKLVLRVGVDRDGIRIAVHGYNSRDRIGRLGIHRIQPGVGSVETEHNLAHLIVVSEKQAVAHAVGKIVRQNRPTRRQRLRLQCAVAQHEGDEIARTVTEVGVHTAGADLYAEIDAVPLIVIARSERTGK